MAPGANLGDEIGFFEATHGTAPKYAGKDVINPSSVVLSGVMMFRYLGWTAAADLIESALEQAGAINLRTESQFFKSDLLHFIQYALTVIFCCMLIQKVIHLMLLLRNQLGPIQ